MKFQEQETIAQFEKEFAKLCKTKYAVSVNSGFSALLVALKASGVGPGDEVIVPDYTFIATATAVSLAGAKPIFVDVLEDATIDPDRIMRAITPKTKAIIPVHLYARRCRMERIRQIAKEYNVKVIEDCAEAIGTRDAGVKIGAWSFHYAKTISTQQGGMITTNDREFAEHCRALAGYAKHSTVPYLHNMIAYNFRMTSMQAVMGLKALKTIHGKLAAMKKKARKLHKKYAPNDKMQDNYWVFVAKNLKKFDRPGFVPMHLQPPYKQPGNFPVSDRLYKELKYLFL